MLGVHRTDVLAHRIRTMKTESILVVNKKYRLKLFSVEESRYGRLYIVGVYVNDGDIEECVFKAPVLLNIPRRDRQ